jgi:LTXXQ motif family protein
MLEMLKEKLSLTDAQVKQVKDIGRTEREQERDVRQDTSLSSEDRRAKLMAARKAEHDQIRAILTPDQQAIFDKLPPVGGRRRPPPDGAEGGTGVPPPPINEAPAPDGPPPPPPN